TKPGYTRPISQQRPGGTDSVVVLDLGERAILLAPKILAGDDGAFDDQLADLAVWKDQPVVPGWDRLVGDADDPQGDSRKRPADTGPFAGAGLRGGVTQDVARGDGGDRQCFRRAVRRVGIGGVGQDAMDPLQHRWRHWRSGHEHAPERGE